jgi:hypothetical protein
MNRSAPDLPEPSTRAAIAAATGLHVRSVTRAFRGAAGAGVHARVTLAALELGLKPPVRAAATRSVA